MPAFYTLKHCLICYNDKEESIIAADNHNQNEEGASATLTSSVVQKSNSNGEICRRFCTLASRYLDIDPFHYHPAKTIITKRSFCYDRVCKDCVEMLKSFCDIYQQIEYLQMQLSWRAHEISEVMKRADKDKDGNPTCLRKSLEENLEKIGSDMVEIDDFRNEFKESVDNTRKEAFPRLELEKKKEGDEYDDDDDPDFVKVTVPIEKKGNNAPEDTSQGTDEPQQTSSKDKQPVTSVAHSSAAFSSKDEGKRRGLEPANIEETPKRQKISIRNRKSASTNRGRGRGRGRRRGRDARGLNENVRATPDNDNPPNGECSSSTMQDSALPDDYHTVISLTDNSDIISSISKDYSLQHEDDLLRRVCGADSEEDPVEGRCAWEEEIMSLEPKASSNSKQNGFQEQFNYLQYTCPIQHCGKKFKTMTRMMVHQRVTGHNLNAVITITTK